MPPRISKTLAAFRRALRRHDLAALHISGTDPHMSEYLSDHWKTRRFISGFSGSYGEVVVTPREALLWTDSRYFLQAEEEMAGTEFRMMPLRVPGEVPPDRWLAENMPPGSRLGFDPYTLPLGSYRLFSQVLAPLGISLVPVPSLVGEIWQERPPLPGNPIFEPGEELAGECRALKHARISQMLDLRGAAVTIVSSLSDLAWCFNLRGSDISYNPLFLGYGLIGKGFNHLFIRRGALSLALEKKLLDEGVILGDYHAFYDFLAALRGVTVWLDPATANSGIWLAIKEQCPVVESTSPAETLKAVKNSTEVEGFRETMRRDGVALVEFLWWLRHHAGDPGTTEFTVARKLAECRSLQPGFMGESFAPIVGTREHGAVVHLSVTADNALPLKNQGVLLFDSGGQYLTGTSDITRTVALGPVTRQQKTDFTLVLKGVIALSSAIFPGGTRGIHLDILARQAMWKHGINYGHGTGHGVGHFLNVHEGPAAIRREWNPHEIKAGMVFSNEPGIYRQGEYGIRTENMMLCIEKETTPFGNFLGFESLTLCPIDTRLLEISLMTPEEISWLNAYHHRVREELSPLLPPERVTFLEELTRGIG